MELVALLEYVIDKYHGMSVPKNFIHNIIDRLIFQKFVCCSFFFTKITIDIRKDKYLLRDMQNRKKKRTDSTMAESLKRKLVVNKLIIDTRIKFCIYAKTLPGKGLRTPKHIVK